VIALGGILLVGGPAAQAQGFCQVVSVPVSQGGFTLTPLDVWAFTSVPAAPPMTSVRQVIVCSPVFFTPVIVAPPVFFVDPSGPTREPRAAPAPGPVVSGVVPPVTVRDLAQDPGQYDRQVVSLVGDAAGLRPSRDPRGTPYIEIRLENGGASVDALAWGTPALHEGQRLRVTGNFYARAPFALAPGSPIRNLLEADVIVALP
jgi:hypothetical protein